MPFDANTIIRILTTLSLGGLLFAVGLRITWREVRDAVWRGHLAWLLPLNFIGVPLLALGLVSLLNIPTEIAAGLMLLAAAPFAPVVPVFARMSRSDLPLAAGLTALFPFISAFLTPLVCEFSFHALPGGLALRFSLLTILAVLVVTITLPMALGVLLGHVWPMLAAKALRPVEIASEAAGAISLAFVTFAEFPSIVAVGWKALLATLIVSEIGMVCGYALGGKSPGSQRVTALGTANRNIALALLIAIDSFEDTPVVGAVVACGLVLILLGLIHVAWWRLANRRRTERDRPNLSPPS